MCGLVAVISKSTISFENLIKMNDKISHRGPNDEGYLLLNSSIMNDLGKKLVQTNHQRIMRSIGFAHRRLSIQDLSPLGHQPMSYKERYWIVYNGEVYNHVELKKELEELGHSFVSHSDTEVILAAYAEWGEQCVSRFNGMWAFLILDTEADSVFISRDRFGVKPLYYFETEEEFVFASEIKSLMEYSNINTSPNENYCKRVIAEGALEFEKETAFKNIYRFDCASVALLDLTSDKIEIKQRKFWDFEVNNSNEKFCASKAQKIADEYYELLKDAVRLRLRADVPFGSALSGGLDSTAIVYLIEEILKEQDSTYQQQTFSTVFGDKDKECDESYFIKLITDELGIKSHTIQPDEESFKLQHEKIIKHWENPMAGTGMAGLTTFNLINQSNVVVTLDGQGADEQQGGYLKYITNYLYNLGYFDALSQTKSLMQIPKARNYLILGFTFRTLKLLFGNRFTMKLALKLIGKKGPSRFIPLNDSLKYDTYHGLINLIHFSDSRSMLFSIESRMPFMDYRLVEFTAKIPACYKIHKGWTKYFARIAFNNKLPDEICWRKDKLGWPIPDGRWFKGELNTFVNDSVKKCFFTMNLVGHKKDKDKDIVNEIGVDGAIKLLNIASWKKIFFNEKIK
ncbi:asparagine synthase (glutamine-hydrolyzing) [Pseudoalteromonas sp. NBT06-2]|uniref:asparagine synthase (glutamine-hydrolyzing) n=1 Tax=Pseudoalteromonas sp. NBT06-2 TaxID=2025950 RepID=UPI000BA7BB4C|nr:asparagine synthase (glutamine-hydrolyzing) [Pseudoalteromonas sp. NBT06-2]PAJ74475.1 asparagine synthase (glutamine-hydrolyzing) [Pseudoalteromonas sp. NBT06-2]